MKITETAISGVLILEPDIFKDSRGWFCESYNEDTYRKLGIDVHFVQDSHSFSAAKGTLRGLHFQNNPHAQSKLVRCTRGAVLDVVVDIRKSSPTYKKWISVELSSENQRQLFIPKGFAHGFVTLVDDTEFQYKVDAYYHKGSERCIAYNDPGIAIDWRIEHPILSERDRGAPLLADCDMCA